MLNVLNLLLRERIEKTFLFLTRRSSKKRRSSRPYERRFLLDSFHIISLESFYSVVVVSREREVKRKKSARTQEHIFSEGVQRGGKEEREREK